MLFLDNGRGQDRSDVVERGMRPVALARKNALFAGSDSGAVRGRRNDVDYDRKVEWYWPLAWLPDVLERLVSGRIKQHEIEQLLSWNWRPPGDVPLAEAA